MTPTMITIYDPEGKAWEMEWQKPTSQSWCDWCNVDLDAGWVTRLGVWGFLVLCDPCLRAQSTEPSRSEA